MKPTDVDMSHGFLSNKGTPAARILTLRVHHNNHIKRKAQGILTAIDNGDEYNYNERSIHRILVESETFEKIDIEDWPKYSELMNKLLEEDPDGFDLTKVDDGGDEGGGDDLIPKEPEKDK